MRCEAAHRDDHQACDGPQDAVIVEDATGHQLHGCMLHGAILLASLEGGKVHPGSVEGAAIEVFYRAQSMKPFSFDK
jgi:hypothetical protein